MVVADHEQHAALFRRASGMAVPDRIAGAVDAGSLPIPQRVDAIDRAGRIIADALRAGDSGRGEILVHRRQELDVVRVQRRLGTPCFGVDARERRAAIAADEAR